GVCRVAVPGCPAPRVPEWRDDLGAAARGLQLAVGWKAAWLAGLLDGCRSGHPGGGHPQRQAGSRRRCGQGVEGAPPAALRRVLILPRIIDACRSCQVVKVIEDGKAFRGWVDGLSGLLQ